MISMKVLLITIGVWLACVVAIGYWYVVVGSQWAPVAAEYEQWKDYRLGFFVLTLLPAAVIVLVAILVFEWRLISRKQRQAEDNPG